MISKKSAVSATRRGLDARKSNMPRKMSKSVCLYLDVERQLLLHPQWRHSSMGIFLFCHWQQQWFKGQQWEKRASCSHWEGAWMLHLGFCTHSSWFVWKGSFPGPSAPCARQEMFLCVPAPVPEL